jgi:hypothetical protein
VHLPRTYLFRGDDFYRGGPVGRALGLEADSANIQDFIEHVLRKESNRTSRYVSFTEELKAAERFTLAPDNRHIRKVEWARLQDLASQGIIQIWDAERVYEALSQGSRKLVKKANDVRAAMRRNSELLIEGQLSEEFFERVN